MRSILPAIKLLPGLFFLLFAGGVHGQTNVSGNQSGTWLKANSPYIVDGTITIPAGQTLTIEPGTKVKIAYGVPFNVSGTLIANGTTMDSIYFTRYNTSPSYPYGGYINILTSSANSSFSYVSIDSLGYNSPITAQKRFSLTNSTIQNTNSSYSIYLNSDTISPTIQNCTFSGDENSRTIGGWAGTFSNVSNNTNAIIYPYNSVNQNSRWPKPGNNSYYKIESTVIVGNGKMLTIEPGTKVKIAYGVPFNINGTLIANGTVTDSVYFTRYYNSPSYPYGGYINILTSSTNSSFNYVSIDSLGYNSPITAQRSFSLTNSTLRNTNSSYSINLNSDTISPVIQNCVFNGSENSRTIGGWAGTFSNVSNNTNAVIYPFNSIIQNSRWPQPGTNSYYKIESIVTVGSGQILTIEPGTKVRIAYGVPFNINGTLIANGTTTDSIYFTRYNTSPSYPYGGYINILTSSVNSSFSYVSFDSLGYNSPITAQRSFTLTNSTLHNTNSSYSIYLNSDTISPTIQNCTFAGNDDSRKIYANPGSLSNVSNNTNAILYLSNGGIVQNSQWNKPGINSFYRIPSSVLVSSGKTLTIQPGSRVLMDAGTYFSVNGTLTANGTVSDSIYFGRYYTNSAYQYGGYFNINASSVNSSFSYVSMDSLGHGNHPITAAGSLSITNSSIRNYGNYALNISRSSVTVSQCSFSSQGSAYAIYIPTDTISPTIQNNVFSGSDNSRSAYAPAKCFSFVKNNINAILRPTGNVGSNIFWPRQANNSYYQIDDAITISNGNTLNIDSGNIINMPSNNSALLVNGTLKAQGTQTAPIRFEKLNGSGMYGGAVVLNASSSGNILSYCSLDKQGGSYGYPLNLYTSNAAITNLSVSNSQNYGVYISGASPTLTAANITNNPYGVYVASGRPVLNNCNISNNTTYGVFNAGNTTDTVDARNCYWGDSTGPKHTTLNPSGTGNRVSDKVRFVPWIQQAIRVNQTINLTAVTDKYLEDTVKLGATASSGLPVSYSMVTSPANGVAILSGDTIIFLNDTGRVTITANQAGNAYFFPAPAQTISFKVQKHSQSIVFNPIAAKTFGDSAFAVRATASSGLPVQLSIISGPATLSQDSIIDLTGAGTVTMSATQAGNRLYFPATPVQQSFTVYPKLPDFAVQEVASTQVLIAPKDTVALTWKLANVGRAASAVNLTERIYIQSSAGANRTLVKQIAYTDSSLLDTGRVILRNTIVAIPAQLIIGDSGVFVVEIVPGSTVQEAPGATANNTGVQPTPWAVNKVLALSLSAHQLTEGSSGISVSISRSGSVAAPLTTTISFKQPQRYNFPTNISIPAGQATVSFSLTVPDDSLLQGTIKDALEVAATGFAGAKDTLTVLDNDNATLSFVNLPAIATEGDTVQFTITTNQPPAAPLTVYLNSGNAARFPLPASVVIPKDSLSAKLVVRLIQNSTPELDAAVSLTAGAAGHNAATATLLVKDDDLPNLELVLQTKTVSEGAGQYATQATLRRTASSNALAFTANLFASFPNTLLLPATVSLAANEAQKIFTIGVIDNTNVDSLRRVVITASVYVASCGCSAPPASAGYVSDTLNVSDNDGPTLLLTTAQQTFPEGITNAGLLRIARNTYTTDSLLVYLSSSDSTEATVPATAVIPAGQTFIEVPITTVSDTFADGNQTVYLNATATGFAQGTTFIVVTDLTKPDLQIATVTVSSNTVQARTIFNYQLGIKNTGAATAPAGVLVRGYLSQDGIIDNTDSLISEDIITSPIAVGQTVPVLNAVMAPNRPGQYKLLFKVNPASAIVELLMTNNTSSPVNFTIAPDYTATAVVAPAYVFRGTTVAVSGLAVKSNGTPVANRLVEVFIVTNGLRRKVFATTDSAGHYIAQFIPLSAEAGHYTIGAGFPGIGDTTTQDAFDILGITINNGDVPQFRVMLGDTLSGLINIQNLSSIALTNFSLVPINLSGGAHMYFDTLSVLAGNSGNNLRYKVIGSILSSGNSFEVTTLQAISGQGNIQTSDAYYFCQTPNALIEASIASINVNVSQSVGERLVEFKLINKGLGATGSITVSLPQVNWIINVTPRVMPSIGSGDTATVILKFLASSQVPFDYPVAGNIITSAQNGNSITLPFTYKKVSVTSGIVQVTATDQFTFYNAGNPKVKGALVKIKNPYSGTIYAQGYTDSTGIFTAIGVPQGNYRITVEKDKHLPYSGTMSVNAGDTVKSTTFLNYQAITFSWTVVPTTVQDRYTIKLTSRFETNIPIPVVTVKFPDSLPTLTGGEVYSFNAILENHGLIVAKDVTLILPTSDPEYEFITNYVTADLNAQTSIQVPVIMRHRTGQMAVSVAGLNSVASMSIFLGINPPMANTAANQPVTCKVFAGVIYWYYCSLVTGLWQNSGIEIPYSGRICYSTTMDTLPPVCYPCEVPPPPPPFIIDTTHRKPVQWNCPNCCVYLPCFTIHIPAIPLPTINFPKPVLEDDGKPHSCVECINNMAGVLGGPKMKALLIDLENKFCDAYRLINLIQGKQIVGCMPQEAGGEAEGDDEGGNNGNNNGGIVGDTYDAYKKAKEAIDKVKELKELVLSCFHTQAAPPVIVPPISTIFPNATANSSGSVYDAIVANLQTFINAGSAKNNWTQEYFGNLRNTDSWKTLRVLLEPYIITLDSIRPTVQINILTAMTGYEIPPGDIQAFFTRWNTSIYALSQNILQPNTQYPGIINWTKIEAYSDSLIDANNEASSRGFGSIPDMYIQANNTLNQIINNQTDHVCASVTVQLNQDLMMTREAFEGTLSIFNGHPTDGMDSLSVNILITDGAGIPSNGFFDTQVKNLMNLSDVTGTGAIGAQQTGLVAFQYIPALSAAPQIPKVYNVGGSVRYWDPYTQGIITIRLSPVPITVNPSPNLSLHYFMERNILGDDALTSPAIEPSIPAELAVMVQNDGYGDAQNLSISSAQPKIVDNEKGLAIDFNLIGSNFQGQPVNFGLNDILFGTIPALQTRVGQWYFTSSLLGKFVSYQADVVHENSYGNPNLSLVNSVQLHELTKSIREYGSKDDGINDFLVNDNFDIANQPDKIYFSQGSRTADVRLAASGSFSSAVLPPSFSNTLTVTANGPGWNYIKLPDPGNRLYDLVSVTRSDGQVIPLNNAWLTFVTLPVSNAPVYENKFHFVDSFRTTAPVTYSVVWKPRNLDVPKVDSILNLPLHVSVVPVQKLRVVFNKQIDPVSFTYQDMMLRLQGGSNIMDSTIVINQIDTTTFEVDLSTLTTGDGFYSLIVQAAGIKDVYGINGLAGKQATWRQFVNTPAVQAFSGIPASHFASSFDKLNVLFNIPIKDSTLTSQRFSITKNGVLQSGTVSIDSISADHKMVYLSGLNNSINQSGTYLFTVDLFNIQGTNNIFGTQQQSIMLTLDNTAPTITSMVKSDSGRLDILHIPFIKIDFSEDILGFDTAAVQLTRNGQVMRLTPNQLLFITGSKKLAGSFGVLTYPEGNYTFKVNLSKLKDSAGNTGSSIEQISWVVDRTSVIAITGVSITPDLGYSATDGVTAGQLFNVQFNLSDSATKVTVSQFDAAGEVVIRTDSAKAAGIVSVPVSLLTGGNTGIKISATGVNGNSSGIRDTLFIDPIPLTARWKLSNDQTLSILPDTVALTVSAKLLSDTGLFHAISFSKNGTAIVMTGAAITKINDTVYHLTGLRQLSSGAGIYQLSFNKQAISKYSSGRSDSGFVVVSWKLKPINHAPVANAGNDFIVVNPGLVGLNGTASSDPDADPISYRWTSLAGIILNDTTSPMPSFTIAAANRDTTYSFLLVVSDGEAFSTDIVKVSTAFSTCSGADRYFVMPKPGSGYNYQWQIDSTGDGFINLSTNAVHLNVSTDTLRLRQPPTAYSGYKYRCVAIKSATSVTSAVYTLRFSNIWNGNTSTAWENPANWSCGVLPDEHTDVLIKANTTYPLKVGINAACRSLTAQNGATVTISAGYNLDVKGK